MDADTQPYAVDLGSEFVELAAEVFALLSDPTRIRLIVALSGGERSVGELADLLGKPGPAVSQHLAKLRWAKVVDTRQDGTRVFYRLVDEHARELVAQAVYQAEHAVDVIPRHHLRASATGAGVGIAALRGDRP